jgi:hypothetical protein
MKGFYRSAKAYYYGSFVHSEGVVCDIMVGDYNPDGGCVGEFAIEWKRLGGNVIPQLRAWDDSWAVLADMPELIALMKNIAGLNITEEQMAAHLVGLGYKDLTAYTQGNDPLA